MHLSSDAQVFQACLLYNTICLSFQNNHLQYQLLQYRAKSLSISGSFECLNLSKRRIEMITQFLIKYSPS